MNVFHPEDQGSLSVPAEAFDLDIAGRPAALQHHLCLEVVNHLVGDHVPFLFQGGTALHTRLAERRRFSIDVDLKCPEPDAVAMSLTSFVEKFPNSDVALLTPPEPLADFGVRHRIHFRRVMFAHQPCQILVELAAAPVGGEGFEPLTLQADSFTWPGTPQAPDLNRFAAQKMSTLGPTTIGKRIGANQQFYKGNQGVCKQLFDLRVLLKENLDAAELHKYYLSEIEEANTIHGTSFSLTDAVPDAQALLQIFRPPRALIDGDTPRRDLWRSFDQIASCVTDTTWGPEELRVTAGCLHRVFGEMTNGEPDLASARAPLGGSDVPPNVLQAIGEAQDRGDEWALDDAFEGSARLAWAWAPAGTL